MIFKTLRWRVQRGHVFVMCLIFPFLVWLPYSLTRHARIDSTDKSLAIAIAHTSTRQLVENDPELTQIFAAPKWYIIYDRWGDVMHQSTNAPQLTIHYNELNFDQFAFIEGHRTLAIRRVNHGRAVLVGLPEPVLYQGLGWLLPALLTGTLTIMALALVIGWWESGKSLSPIKRMAETARAMNRSNQLQEIDLDGTEHELRELGEVLNDAFKRLHFALEQQRNLTADVSHELRTPISIILLELESALRKERSADEYIDRIQSSLETTEHLKRLVDSLLILARADAGLDDIELCNDNLEDCCHEAAKLLAPKAHEDKVSITTELESVQLSFDFERIKQVLINLMNNAIQYGGPGTQIKLSLTRTKEHAEVRVTDNGPGISNEVKARLFDRFYREDDTRSTRQGNLGLGLSISKSIVGAHKGSIELEPTESGTCFIIILPICTE